MNFERYHRQIRLKEFGEEAQGKLLSARVIIIGAGGLGSPVLQYLTAAGTGTLVIVDDDVVSLSNLQRQVLYSTDDIGKPKAGRAAEILRKINPDIEVIAYNTRLTSRNALDLIGSSDLVIDGSDNFTTRYLVNDACILLDKTLIYGAISRFEGQVAVFNYPQKNNTRSCNYRDLFPDPPVKGRILNCEETGVLGVLPGIIGSIQAGEAIKILTGIGEPLINKLRTINVLSNQIYDVELSASVKTCGRIPVTVESFPGFDYDLHCNFRSTGATDIEITPDEFLESMPDPDTVVIDIRETHETPDLNIVPNMRIPLSGLKDRLPGIPGSRIIMVCQTGQRSLQAVRVFKDLAGAGKRLLSLKGGVLKLSEKQEMQDHEG